MTEYSEISVLLRMLGVKVTDKELVTIRHALKRYDSLTKMNLKDIVELKIEIEELTKDI